MLIILYGTSCVGKTSIERTLIERHNLKPVKCYVTRKVRIDDVNRVHVTHSEFRKLRREGEIKVENNLYGNLYGASESDLMKATKTDTKFILDFSIHNYKKLIKYNPKNIVITVDDIRSRIELSGRTNRKSEILEEYNKYYNDVKLEEYKKLGFNVILNSFSEFEQCISNIENILNEKER